ncbi:hypothetical protein [Roseateles oligotrophus]|uniref:Uncharacterized protein n=1 Tax=Roseateles oligotrophus TaxID=1769250 RepID=A0ABT2YA21_9BURK|nr:hypothetical protein [Roseateles oligotrophus]MCV2367152.1 hypothetical protein [Roseateles oligotrophus]
MMMTSKNGRASLLKTLLSLSQDPQSWISMLAVLTLLGVGSGALESADRPSEPRPQFSKALSPAQSHPPAPMAEEQMASLDASKL